MTWTSDSRAIVVYSILVVLFTLAWLCVSA
jgi:hypothetical protein